MFRLVRTLRGVRGACRVRAGAGWGRAGLCWCCGLLKVLQLDLGLSTNFKHCGSEINHKMFNREPCQISGTFAHIPGLGVMFDVLRGLVVVSGVLPVIPHNLLLVIVVLSVIAYHVVLVVVLEALVLHLQLGRRRVRRERRSNHVNFQCTFTGVYF